MERQGKIRTVTWLPSRFAKIGDFVELKNKDGTWTDGWKVISAGSQMKTSSLVERSQDYKRTRKASDI